MKVGKCNKLLFDWVVYADKECKDAWKTLSAYSLILLLEQTDNHILRNMNITLIKFLYEGKILYTIVRNYELDRIVEYHE